MRKALGVALTGNAHDVVAVMIAVRDLLGIAFQNPQFWRHAAFAVIGRVEPLAVEPDLQADVTQPALLDDVDLGVAVKALHHDEAEQRLEDQHGFHDYLPADRRVLEQVLDIVERPLSPLSVACTRMPLRASWSIEQPLMLPVFISTALILGMVPKGSWLHGYCQCRPALFWVPCLRTCACGRTL